MYLFNAQKIRSILDAVPREIKTGDLKEVLVKGIRGEEIPLEDVVVLLRAIRNEEQFQKVLRTADKIKRKVFGGEVKIYVPVYITNVCANNCFYCGFRKDNRQIVRSTLTVPEYTREIEFVTGLGHRTIEIVLGYHPVLRGPKLAEYIETTKSCLALRGGGSTILMSEPMEEEEYRTHRTAGLDEVYCWLETYDETIYSKVHPSGTHKANFNYRLQIFDRVLRAGIKRYGMGILFGLGPYEFDVLSLMDHAAYLQNTYGIPPYAFGIPRLKKAHGAKMQKPIHRISNREYRLAVAISRIVFPTAHTYMNTRENLTLLLQLLKGGGSEINAEASTRPGGYTEHYLHDGEQFFHYSYDSKKVLEILKANEMNGCFDEAMSVIVRRQ